MKNVIIYLLMVLSSTPVFGGFRSKLPVKWGRITPAEFSVSPLGAEATSPAIVLCDYGDIEISNRTFYTRHTRIKILNQDGLKYATVEIPYVSKNKHDVFYQFRAQTMILQDGHIVKYEVKPSQIEDIPINERWSKKKFTFPNVEPGVIIEFQYKIASLDFEKLDTWYFQREIPTIWSEVRFNVPPPFVYLVNFKNNRGLNPDEELAYGRKLEWLYNTKARRRHFELIDDHYLLFNTAENRFKVWALNDMRKKVVMKNLPGLKSDDAVANPYPQVSFDLFESSGNLPRTFRPLLLTTHDDYENKTEWEMMHSPGEFIGYVHFRLKTWSQFNDYLLKHERFGQYLQQNAGRLDPSFTASMNDADKINAIYQFVIRQFRWNGTYANMATQPFREFLEKETGSSAELNLLLVNLFRQYGIASDPVLIRTVDLGYPEKMYPVKNQFNHVIASAEIAGKIYLFDATGNSSGIDKLNKLDIGTQGWIVRNENPGWIETYIQHEGEEEAPVFNM